MKKLKMKRFWGLLLAFSLVLTSVPLTGLAETGETEESAAVSKEKDVENEPVVLSEDGIVASGTCGDNVIWELDDAGKLTISGSGEMTDYPDYESVPWYSYIETTGMVTDVVIEEGITSISQYAFYTHYSDYKNVAEMHIPSSVTVIGAYAFYGWDGLEKINFPDDMTEIGSNAFSYSAKLTSIELPKKIHRIGTSAFLDSGLTTVYGYAKTYAETYAKNNNLVFVELGIDENPTIIANGTCGDDLNWVLDTSGTLYITGSGEMTDYSDYESVPWYSYIETTGMVTDVVIEEGITSISQYAFYTHYSDYKNVAEMHIPSSVTVIGAYAFYGWVVTDSIYFYGNAPHIGDNCFYDAIITAYYPSRNSTWTNEIMQNYGGTITWVEWNPDNNSESPITFDQDYVCEVGESISITATYISENEPTDISWTCSNENAVTFSDTSIQGPSVTGEENTWWVSTMVTGVTVGSYDITLSIGNSFAKTGLTIVIATGICGDDLTWIIDSDGTLIISGSGDMYSYKLVGDSQDLAPWLDYGSEINDIYIEDNVTSIGSYAFSSLRKVEMVTVGKNIHKIGEYAFRDTGSEPELKIVFCGDAPVIDMNTFGNDDDNTTPRGIDIYYNQTNDGWTDIIAQKYNNHSLAWIYSEDASYKLSESDMWSLVNEASYFGGEDNGWYISRTDYDKLLKNLEKNEQKAVKKYYNVDGKLMFPMKWEGSCYGMSSVLALVKNGSLSIKDFSNANSLFDVDYDSNPISEKTQSVINFYMWQQVIPSVQAAEEAFALQEQEKQISKMESLVSQAEKNGTTALISFAYKKNENTTGNHAILGYAIEYGTFNIRIQNVDYQFDRRILTYDPAYAGNEQKVHSGAIYYNDICWAMTGLYDVVSKNNDLDITSTDNTAKLKLVITDTNHINAVDYKTGETNFQSVPTSAYLYTDADSFVIDSITGTDGVNNRLFDGSHTISENGSVIIGISAESDSNTNLPLIVGLPKLDSDYTITTSDILDFSILYSDYYLSARSERSGSVSFEDDGKINVLSDEPCNNYLSITMNDDCALSEYDTFDISFSNTSDITLDLVDESILLSGDNLNDVTISCSNDNESKEITISTEKDSILVSDNDNDGGIAVYEDENGDGIYETDITKKEEVKTIDLSTCKLTLLESEYTYDSTAKEPTVTITNGDQTLTEGADYTVTYSDNVNAGTASVTATGQGNYTGTITETFTIKKADQEIKATISSANLTEGETAAIDASAVAGTLSYSSSDTAVATVDENGVVTAVSVGTVTITISTEGNENYNPATTAIEITVTEKPQQHTHEYGDPVFEWAEDYSCKAVFTCKDKDDEQTLDCTVTSEVTDPTCTKDGETVYTATVEFDGQNYTDTKTVPGDPATGHSYEYTDNGDGTHTATCVNGDDSLTEDHVFKDGVCICGAKEETPSESESSSEPESPAEPESPEESESTEPGKPAETVKPWWKAWLEKWFGNTEETPEETPSESESATEPEQPSESESDSPTEPEQPSESAPENQKPGFNIWDWLFGWWW